MSDDEVISTHQGCAEIKRWMYSIEHVNLALKVPRNMEPIATSNLAHAAWSSSLTSSSSSSPLASSSPSASPSSSSSSLHTSAVSSIVHRSSSSSPLMDAPSSPASVIAPSSSIDPSSPSLSSSPSLTSSQPSFFSIPSNTMVSVPSTALSFLKSSSSPSTFSPSLSSTRSSSATKSLLLPSSSTRDQSASKSSPSSAQKSSSPSPSSLSSSLHSLTPSLASSPTSSFSLSSPAMPKVSLPSYDDHVGSSSSFSSSSVLSSLPPSFLASSPSSSSLQHRQMASMASSPSSSSSSPSSCEIKRKLQLRLMEMLAKKNQDAILNQPSLSSGATTGNLVTTSHEGLTTCKTADSENIKTPSGARDENKKEEATKDIVADQTLLLKQIQFHLQLRELQEKQLEQQLRQQQLAKINNLPQLQQTLAKVGISAGAFARSASALTATGLFATGNKDNIIAISKMNNNLNVTANGNSTTSSISNSSLNADNKFFNSTTSSALVCNILLAEKLKVLEQEILEKKNLLMRVKPQTINFAISASSCAVTTAVTNPCTSTAIFDLNNAANSIATAKGVGNAPAALSRVSVNGKNYLVANHLTLASSSGSNKSWNLSSSLVRTNGNLVSDDNIISSISNGSTPEQQTANLQKIGLLKSDGISQSTLVTLSSCVNSTTSLLKTEPIRGFTSSEEINEFLIKNTPKKRRKSSTSDSSPASVSKKQKYTKLSLGCSSASGLSNASSILTVSCNSCANTNGGSNKQSETTPGLENLKVFELKVECRKRHLSVSGNKQSLLMRLMPFSEAILQQQQQQQLQATDSDASLSCGSASDAVMISQNDLDPTICTSAVATSRDQFAKGLDANPATSQSLIKAVSPSTLVKPLTGDMTYNRAISAIIGISTNNSVVNSVQTKSVFSTATPTTNSVFPMNNPAGDITMSEKIIKLTPDVATLATSRLVSHLLWEKQQRDLLKVHLELMDMERRLSLARNQIFNENSRQNWSTAVDSNQIQMAKGSNLCLGANFAEANGMGKLSNRFINITSILNSYLTNSQPKQLRGSALNQAIAQNGALLMSNVINHFLEQTNSHDSDFVFDKIDCDDQDINCGGDIMTAMVMPSSQEDEMMEDDLPDDHHLRLAKEEDEEDDGDGCGGNISSDEFDSCLHPPPPQYHEAVLLKKIQALADLLKSSSQLATQNGSVMNGSSQSSFVPFSRPFFTPAEDGNIYSMAPQTSYDLYQSGTLATSLGTGTAGADLSLTGKISSSIFNINNNCFGSTENLTDKCASSFHFGEHEFVDYNNLTDLAISSSNQTSHPSQINQSTTSTVDCLLSSPSPSLADSLAAVANVGSVKSGSSNKPADELWLQDQSWFDGWDAGEECFITGDSKELPMLLSPTQSSSSSSSSSSSFIFFDAFDNNPELLNCPISNLVKQ